MRLTVLGCSGPYPAADAGTSGYLLTSNDTNLLLECGCGVVPKLWRAIKPGQLSAVVLTHFHFDHISDFSMLTTTVQFEKMKGKLDAEFRIPVYLPKEPEDMASFVKHLPGAEHFDFRFVKPGDTAWVGPFCLAFTDARHPLPCFGVKASDGQKCLYYTGDTNTMDRLAEQARGTDAILADCGLRNEDWSESAPHLSAAACGRLAKDAGVSALYLGHLPPYVKEDVLLSQARAEFPAAQLLHPSDEIEI